MFGLAAVTTRSSSVRASSLTSRGIPAEFCREVDDVDEGDRRPPLPSELGVTV